MPNRSQRTDRWNTTHGKDLLRVCRATLSLHRWITYVCAQDAHLMQALSTFVRPGRSANCGGDPDRCGLRHLLRGSGCIDRQHEEIERRRISESGMIVKRVTSCRLCVAVAESLLELCVQLSGIWFWWLFAFLC